MMKCEVKVTENQGNDSSTSVGITIEQLRMIAQDSHLNFLIGAGTSLPFFKQLGDVEQVLGEFKSEDDATRLIRASLQGYFFENVLLPNLKLMECKAEEPQKLIKSYGRLVAILNRILLKRRSTLLGKQVNIFTTNVDMAFELSLELLEIDTNDGFNGKIRPRLDLGEFSTLKYRQGTRFEYRSEIPAFNLFKLHGSVGWRLESEEIYFDHRLELLQKVDEAFQAAKSNLIAGLRIDSAQLSQAASGKSLNEKGKSFSNCYNQLQIVNPEKTKFYSTVLNKTYYELIRRLANELEKENSALFVHGFSFRDEHILDLVLRAAATNPTLQVIVFCYNQKSYINIRSLFPDERVKNGNILLVRPAEPNGEEAERELSLDIIIEDFLLPILAEKVSLADHIIELRLSGQAEKTEDV
jgi:hypothetical protein